MSFARARMIADLTPDESPLGCDYKVNYPYSIGNLEFECCIRRVQIGARFGERYLCLVAEQIDQMGGRDLA